MANMKALSIAAAALVLLGCRATWAAPTVFVSPQGNDAWTGALAAPNAGGTDGPLATLPAALQRVRETRAPGDDAAGGRRHAPGSGSPSAR